MCPTTTALGRLLLILFYLAFDIPSMMSRRIFVKKLAQLRGVVEEMAK